VRDRFGKGDLVASILGMLTALGAFVFLGALFAAGAANVELQTSLLNAEGTLDEVDMVAAVAAIAVVFVSFLVGGIAAGRIARYDGGLNGVGAALWMLLLVTIFAALGAFVGAEYNAFANGDLPNWIAQIDAEDVTVEAIVLAIVAVAAMFAGGYLGGRIGESYHRKVDAAIVNERDR
jgi:hypothetical protein